MKKALIITIAALLMAAPLAQAQTRMDHNNQTRTEHRKPQAHHQTKKFSYQKVKAKQHWSRGQRMNDWKRHSSVSDYKHRGLRKPGNGQRWVKVDNQYLLISITSGLIAGIVAAR